MALKGQAHLHHAPAQKDEADGADQGKDKLDRLFTTPNGSLAAKAVVVKRQVHSTAAM